MVTLRRGMLTYGSGSAERGHNMFSRPVIAVATGCAALMLAAGCGSDGDDASVTTGGKNGRSAPASAKPSATAHGDPDHGASACGTAALRARLTLNGAAAGNRFATLVLTNTGAAPCRTYGYAGLRLTGGGDPPTKTKRSTETGKPERVTLKPGKSAWSRLQWGTVPGAGDHQNGDCQPTATGLWVTPPDQRAHLAVNWSYGPVCERGTVNVNPLRPGDHDPRAA